jgi:MOSC domain-containing protein YiiM
MGRLLAIARAPQRRAPLVELENVEIGVKDGVDGDSRGAKAGRQVTVVFREGWDAACRDLGMTLPWTTRRANLFVEGLRVPRVGEKLVIGTVVLEVTQETAPCSIMEAAQSGLRAALTPEWRGGVCCSVRGAGRISVGDEVHLAS